MNNFWTTQELDCIKNETIKRHLFTLSSQSFFPHIQIPLIIHLLSPFLIHIEKLQYLKTP